MKEKCIEKIKEWFGNCDFEYEIVKSTENGCIFVTMSEDSGEKMISLYRVKLGDDLEIVKEYEQSIGYRSLLWAAELLRVYERVSA